MILNIFEKYILIKKDYILNSLKLFDSSGGGGIQLLD